MLACTHARQHAAALKRHMRALPCRSRPLVTTPQRVLAPTTFATPGVWKACLMARSMWRVSPAVVAALCRHPAGPGVAGTSLNSSRAAVCRMGSCRAATETHTGASHCHACIHIPTDACRSAALRRHGPQQHPVPTRCPAWPPPRNVLRLLPACLHPHPHTRPVHTLTPNRLQQPPRQVHGPQRHSAPRLGVAGHW